MSLLEVSGATQRFGTLEALADVSLTVEQGELRAIIGPNGAGKTTLFNLVSGLHPPTAGRIVFAGQDVTRLAVEQRVARGIARTFQITQIFPELTVRENVQVAVEVAAGLRLRPWLSKAALAPLRERTDELLAQGGIDHCADRTAGELAHGDQRATEIMMALALRPRLLLLDEPTAGMGDQETHLVTGLVQRLHEAHRLTILLIEHDMRVVFGLADRILVLAEGKVLAEGTADEIGADERVQAAYLGKSS